VVNVFKTYRHLPEVSFNILPKIRGFGKGIKPQKSFAFWLKKSYNNHTKNGPKTLNLSKFFYFV
jgi:hypothetical protein